MTKISYAETWNSTFSVDSMNSLYKMSGIFFKRSTSVAVIRRRVLFHMTPSDWCIICKLHFSVPCHTFYNKIIHATELTRLLDTSPSSSVQNDLILCHVYSPSCLFVLPSCKIPACSRAVQKNIQRRVTWGTTKHR